MGASPVFGEPPLKEVLGTSTGAVATVHGWLGSAEVLDCKALAFGCSDFVVGGVKSRSGAVTVLSPRLGGLWS